MGMEEFHCDVNIEIAVTPFINDTHASHADPREQRAAANLGQLHDGVNSAVWRRRLDLSPFRVVVQVC